MICGEAQEIEIRFSKNGHGIQARALLKDAIAA
jgi:hypothetical protein